jgi:hypothetical protein
MAQPLDIDVVNLSKAIRQVETGNRPVSGASGEMASRYQYMPATWKSTAQKYLGDANAPLTLENENKATYLKIKDWKDAGYKPDQIASMWNSGKPEWQGKVGVNSSGVKYDVPGYVSKVGAEYKKIKGSTVAPVAAAAAPTITADQQADAATQERYGSVFGANTENPTMLGESAKMLGNLPKSAWNFAKGAIDIINPITIAKNIGKAATDAKELVREAGGVGKALSFFGKAVPGTAYESFVPEAARGAITAIGGAVKKDDTKIDEGLKTFQRAIVNDPVGQIAPFLMAAKGVAEKAGAGAKFDAAISKVASPVTVPAKAIAQKVASGTAGATKFGIGQATGLQPETIAQITESPKAFTKQARASVDRLSLGKEVQSALQKRQATIAETGESYKPIRESVAPVKVNAAWLNAAIKGFTGLDIKEGKMLTSGAAKLRESGDVRAIQYLYDTWKPVFNKGKMTANEFLNFRQDLAGLARYDRQIGKSQPVEAFAKAARAKFNEKYRSQLTGLDKLDLDFSNQSGEIKTLTKGMVDKTGNLTDAAVNRIANAAGKGKDLLLARLEEVSPGITKKIKILKAVEDIQAASGVKVGTYARGAAIGGGLLLGGLPQAVLTAILTSPEIAVPILRSYGMLKNSAVVQNVVNLLKNTANQVNQIPSNAQKLLKKPVSEIRMPVGLSIEDVSRKPATVFGKPKIEYKSATEAMNSPEMKKKYAEAISQMGNKKVAGKSNNLYHTTSIENLESIKKEGLVVGKKARFEGVSSPKKISFSANEKGASYYGGKNDVMIRTKTSYKPDDLESDILAGGEGMYTTGKNIPPEMLQIKINGKWVDLLDNKKTVLGKKQTAPAKATPKAKNISDPLIQEAKKYKSVEEFKAALQDNPEILADKIKPQIIPISEVKMTQNPVWDSENSLDKKWVRGFAKELQSGSKFPPIFIDNTGKIIDGNHRFEALAKNGATNVEVYKLPSQLTDIWNKANKTNFGK